MTAATTLQSPVACRDYVGRCATRDSDADLFVGYARQPFPGPALAAQVQALETAGCSHVHRDIAGGAAIIRPGLEAALASLSPGSVLVTKDLQSLSWREDGLCAVLATVEASRAHLVAYAEGLDTRRDYSVFDLSRTLEAFAANVRLARKAEASLTRPDNRSRIPDADWAEVKPMIDSRSLSVTEAATRLGVNRSTVYRRIGEVP